jgi:hypothetical protein
MPVALVLLVGIAAGQAIEGQDAQSTSIDSALLNAGVVSGSLDGSLVTAWNELAHDAAVADDDFGSRRTGLRTAGLWKRGDDAGYDDGAIHSRSGVRVRRGESYGPKLLDVNEPGRSYGAVALRADARVRPA